MQSEPILPAAAAASFSWSREAAARVASSHSVVLRGARLHYRRWSRGVGPPLLLVHGFGGHTHWWDWIAPAFCADFDVVALDLSGMGDSDWRPSYPADTFALDILGLLEHLAVGPARVVGHSFGGARLLDACAIDSASGRAPRIAQSVVVDSIVRLEGVPMPTGALRVGARQPYATLATALQRFRLNPPQDVADPAMLDYLARRSLRETPDGWRWKFDPNLPAPEHRDARELLERIRMPVAIVYGEHSKIVNRRMAEASVALLPQGRGPIEIRGGHHHLMLDQPLALIEVLRTLLSPPR